MCISQLNEGRYCIFVDYVKEFQRNFESSQESYFHDLHIYTFL